MGIGIDWYTDLAVCHVLFDAQIESQLRYAPTIHDNAALLASVEVVQPL